VTDTPQPNRLFNRNFILLWQGQLVSKLGSQAHSVALMLWVKHATGSATIMGSIVMAASLPAVVIAPFAGAIADRSSRRGIIIISDLLAGLAVLSLAALMFWSPDATTATLVWMFVVAVILSLTMVFFGTAGGAAIPDLVPPERLSAANSMNRLSDQLAGFLGQGAGGVLFRILGAPLLFLFDAVSYLYAAASSCFMRIPEPSRDHAASRPHGWRRLKTDIAEGFQFIWTHPGLRSMFIFAAILNFFFSPISVLLPFFVEDTLHASSDWYGYLIAALGVGSACGYGIAAAFRGPAVWRARLTLAGMVLLSSCILALGLVSTIGWATAVIAALGIFLGFVNVTTITLIQKAVPTEIRGRVFGLLTTLMGGLVPIAQGLTGVVADAVDQNTPAILIFCGGATMIWSLALIGSRSFREFLTAH
jgi:MFS transporter, DHA3 family, macrolide efflux protein